MALDEAGQNIVDFLKLILKIFLLLMVAQLVLDVTGANVDIPFAKTVMNAVSGWLKSTFNVYEINM